MGKPQLVAAEAPNSFVTNTNSVEFVYDTMAQAFPEVEPGVQPYGTMVLVQIRHPKMFSAGGIKLPPEARSTEYYNTQVAKVIAIGPMCFMTVKEAPDGQGGYKDIVRPWAQGAWFKIGDFVRVQKYGGDRFTVKFEYTYLPPMLGGAKSDPITETDEVIFAMFKAHEVLGLITADPLRVKSFFD